MVPANEKELSMYMSRKLSIILGAVLPVLAVTAQDAPKGEGRPAEGVDGVPPPAREMRGGERRIMHGGMKPSGLIFARMLSRPEFIKGLGLPDDVADKLVAGLKKIEDQEKGIRDELDALRDSQAEALATLVSDRSKTGDEIRAASGKIEELQGKLFGLGVDRILLIRDNLTDEQIKQASELVKESHRDEIMKRRGRGGPDGQQRWRGPRDGGRRGNPNVEPKDGDGPKDGPKDAPPPPPAPQEEAQ